jgi:hypothetical protein
VGQYTGLEGKGDEMIFEGDIVRDEVSGLSGVVYWQKEHASFCWANGQTLVHAADLEVIGNIYDNPELERGIKQWA